MVKLTLVLFILEALFCFTLTVSANEPYEDDIYFFLNEVENKAKDVQRAVELLLQSDWMELPEQIKDLIEETIEKSETVLTDLEYKVQEFNSTYQGAPTDCLIELQKSTENEIEEYLGFMSNLCGTEGDNATLQDIQMNVTANVEQSEKLFEEFLFGVTSCAHTTNYLDCEENLEKQIRAEGEEILETTNQLAEDASIISRGYITSAELCVKIIHEKIDLIETNVRNGIRDCTPTVI